MFNFSGKTHLQYSWLGIGSYYNLINRRMSQELINGKESSFRVCVVFLFGLFTQINLCIMILIAQLHQPICLNTVECDVCYYLIAILIIITLIHLQWALEKHRLSVIQIWVCGCCIWVCGKVVRFPDLPVRLCWVAEMRSIYIPLGKEHFLCLTTACYPVSIFQTVLCSFQISFFFSFPEQFNDF